MSAPAGKTSASPEWIVVRSFALAVLAGGFLLSLPVCNSRHEWTSLLDATFTACSAICVTGLAVVDTGTHYSAFGQGVILFLIQIGGLGIMTLGTLLLVMMGRRLGMQNEFVLINSLGYDRIKGLPSLLKRAATFTVLFEAAGAIILAHRFASAYGLPLPKAVYYGIFHSISAFCNAGFGLYPDSLIPFQRDPVILMTIALLIIAGGIGFLVLYDLSSIRFWRRNRFARGRLTLHTKVVLKTSLILILLGWALIALFEWWGALAGLGIRDKLSVSLFHSVVPRTAGFNAVDLAKVHPGTLFLTMALMFIGGSPCSTAGGIKTTTVAILLRTMLSLVRGKQDIESHGRAIAPRLLREAFSIFIMSIVLVFTAFLILLVTECPPLLSLTASRADELLFEVISAFGTVGLSTGITPNLSPAGKVVIMLLMFVGRVGPLTLALTVGRKEVRQAIRLPEEELIVG